MSDEPTSDNSFNPSGKASSEKKSADPLREQKPSDQPPSRIVWFLFLLALAPLSILLTKPPAPLPERAPADQFSAARALPHIQALAARPRPVGTPAHAEAQSYLIAQLKQLGLEPQVQKSVAVHGDRVANVENVLARLPGSRSGGKAVLLMAHYDSVPAGPGASDDGSGVAALLETARALKAGSRPLAKDVIFSPGGAGPAYPCASPREPTLGKRKLVVDPARCRLVLSAACHIER